MKYLPTLFLGLFLACLFFTSCGDSTENQNLKKSLKEYEDALNKKDSSKKMIDEGNEEESKEDLIIGTWEHARKVKYVFKDGGRLSYVFYQDDEIIEKGTGEYEIIDSELIFTRGKGSQKPLSARIMSINNEKLVLYTEEEGKVVFRKID